MWDFLTSGISTTFETLFCLLKFFYPYNYYGELYLFDESVDVLMRICCEIDVCCFCLDPVMKSIVPVVMAGVLGIYGLIIAVIISTGINPKAKSYYLFDGYAHLSSGLACGLAGLSAGMAIGIVGDAGVRYNSSALVSYLWLNSVLIWSYSEVYRFHGDT